MVQTDLSSKLCRALKHAVRSYSAAVYHQIGTFLYKLPGENRWQGPAVIIGQEKKAVIVKHGSIIGRENPCNLQLKDNGKIIASAVNDDVTNICHDTPASKNNDIYVTNTTHTLNATDTTD